MTVAVYDDLDVRRRLMTHCQMKGGPEEFAAEHKLDVGDVLMALRGQAILSAKLLKALGYERVTRYVEVAP